MGVEIGAVVTIGLMALVFLLPPFFIDIIEADSRRESKSVSLRRFALTHGALPVILLSIFFLADPGHGIGEGALAILAWLEYGLYYLFASRYVSHAKDKAAIVSRLVLIAIYLIGDAIVIGGIAIGL